jgi:diguanylate cyclase (GGDEF)-like protein
VAVDQQQAVDATASSGIPAKVLAVVAPVIVAGAGAVGLALFRYADAPRSASDLAALLGLLASMALAERFPVPVEGMGAGGVTLGFVFSVSAIILLGWPAGVLVAAGGPTFTHLLQRRPLLRVAYNGAMFALSALAAGLAVEHVHGNSVGLLVARVVLCGFLYYWVVNLILISAVLSADSGRSFFTIARENITQTTAPFAFMASAALTLIVLWQRQPALSIALVGPLLAIALYQRSTFEAIRAMRLALTDPLTGLGNRRHFHERLREEVRDARRHHRQLALCLADIDDFKLVNDRFGHPAGDRVLAEVAARLRQGGESFRVGGDEFALLLPAASEDTARRTASSIVERVAALELEGVGSVTVSVGVAVADSAQGNRDDLIRRADAALYAVKKSGKNSFEVAASEPGPSLGARSAA